MSVSPRPLFSLPLPSGRTLELGRRTIVMGIVNVTPDSFADGGVRLDPETAAADAVRMVEAGADLLDIGGESTRPGAEPVSAAEELRRVLPVLEALRGRVAVPLSIDTYKADVAERALALGADIVNDVSGLQYDVRLGGVVARRGAALVLMHTRGRPAEMYRLASYRRLEAEVSAELSQAMGRAAAAGIGLDCLLLDPGLGFAKWPEHTLALCANLDAIAALRRPVLVGPSRKSFLKAALGDVPPERRAWGTAAAVTAAILAGAHVVRVHDVAEMVQVAKVADAIRGAAGTSEA